MPSAGTYDAAHCGLGVTYMTYQAAIDLDTRYSECWRWAAKEGAGPIWRNQIPVEIVRVFEKNGFIWRGYWYHFDTMHFEYRPEFLPAALPAPSK